MKTLQGEWNILTRFADSSVESRSTVAVESIDGIVARGTILAWIAGTFVDVCLENKNFFSTQSFMEAAAAAAAAAVGAAAERAVAAAAAGVAATGGAAGAAAAARVATLQTAINPWPPYNTSTLRRYQWKPTSYNVLTMCKDDDLNWVSDTCKVPVSHCTPVYPAVQIHL